MKILNVLKVLNQMQADQVIERYAIGGAVGATFYLEPAFTYDVDVFIELHSQGTSLLISLDPISDYLRKQGYRMEGEYFVISEWPVQFLPPTGPLVEEAIEQSVQIELDGEMASVFTAEHLAAIALQTGRAKDKSRLLQFIESNAIGMEEFEAIITAHSLTNAWETFRRQYLN